MPHSTSPEVLPPINVAQIDALIPFLEPFEAAGFAAGRVETREGQVPWFSYNDIVLSFLEALYDNGWITTAFKWPQWQESAWQLVRSPAEIETADATTIQRLLIVHVRKDRFCGGHLADMFEIGHIVALLRRLKAIRATMKSP